MARRNAALGDTMEDPAMTPTTKKDAKMRKAIVLSVIILALLAIIVSVFSLMNPQGVQVDDTTDVGIVEINKNGIMPQEISIEKGQTIEWINNDQKPHKLMVTSANPPQELEGFGTSDPLLQGETYSFTFDVSGSFTYEDPENPEAVKGTVVVE